METVEAHRLKSIRSIPVKNRELRDQLSPREIQIISLAGRGRANKQIARELFLSEKTVKNHLSRIFTKLRVESRVSAVVESIRGGILDIDHLAPSNGAT